MPAPSVWLFVLARDPHGAKRRLAPVLDESARAELAIAMLGDMLEASRAVAFARRVVVTESAAVRDVARAAGVDALDTPLADTNAAARAAFAEAVAAGAAASLVLAADLPLAHAADIAALVDAGRDADVVIAPDRHMRGTNALLLVPPARIAPAFGDDSLRLHQERARAAGATQRLVTARGLCADLDDPDDLRLIRDDPGLGPRTSAVLRTVTSVARASR
ncbi:MAG TPA: 2-phospho-L-lactate guanylyltransferase [Candidatus Acidoferrales bacterium]|nr:2-phospho-L-lactate guanylyltransferase [Candidatus Acidoferrales bacterium]